MFSTIKFVIITNVIIYLAVFAEETLLGVLSLHHVVDYAFITLVISWGSAALLHMSLPFQSSKKGKVSLLKRDEVMNAKKNVLEAQKEESTSTMATIIKLAWAGVPSLIFVLIYHFLF
ncbi:MULTISPECIES: hypothetical protein [Vibrio]|uniref:DUF3899 domain-containing protein n=2 Tax=Vibrio TaxID=662 RepID=A0A7X4RW43_9VIBR|nr:MULTISPECIES: hypothetical protein [Vibrio]MBF9002276.1 hypothetical protein [Vibrio nitrifigilis]MZI94942.1 hypothetical protein [Vibrio eleionomae]